MKRKIKNFSDFLECIKAGKKVTDDTNRFYFLQNGYICSKDEDDYGWHNTSIDTDELSRMEVEEEEQFKIEVGKFYRTRGGKKAYCIYREEGNLYPNRCAIDGYSDCTTYTDGGLVLRECENNDDIVGYWEE